MVDKQAETPSADTTGARTYSGLVDEDRYEIFNDDQLSLKAALIYLVAALVGGSVIALVSWFAFHRLSLPAFGGSQLTRAVATALIVITLTLTTVLLYFFAIKGKDNRPRWLTWPTYLMAYMSPAILVVSAVGLPLGSTKLWLDGLSVDQEFRTEYLTRMAAEPGLHDMSYIDIPSFYPAGWFFLGGRLANILGIPGWEVFQPWALITLAAAGCVLVPVWQRLSGSLPVAAGIALTTTAVALATVADEPYAAVVAMGLPAMTVMAWRGLTGAWSAMFGVLVFLGISATFYTLYTAVGALIVVVLAVVAWTSSSSWLPAMRLLIMGGGSMLIAATVWAPYLLAVATGAPRSGATATHYLPPEGAQLPLPMFAASVIGVLCFIGVVRMLVSATEPDARALGLGTLVLYGWVVASMVATLLGRTLLGFRLTAPITFMLIAAGVVALADARLNGIEKYWPQATPPHIAKRVSAVMAAVLLLAGIGYAQSIPNKLHGAIDLAHTDTDGNGERADRFPPNAGAWYSAVDHTLKDAGLEPSQTVVLSDEKNFQALYPWYGFQAMTSHYANPLGEFDRRNQALEAWSEIRDPDELVRAMDETPWQGPDAIVLRGTVENSGDEDATPLTLDIADDIYPNNPNVVFRSLNFSRSAFEKHWELNQVGPFVVAVRK
ncbi:galactan 5-O-arabinofuranosyltransferase [uncultured Corynebacterium sp.]|uniref:galactan 5-O-arabinofuranosyltransferase n=1 Tax=uncultured Corynebacterium sp. TaxID=159447 RepID=UPI0026251B8F|nr:galactan 5-O-arabinofuranosyltransferase [uncultured Corynebacterium sp.]